MPNPMFQKLNELGCEVLPCLWYSHDLSPTDYHFFFFFFPFIFISWRLITLQYCSGFCHTLTWISHGFTCVPHPDPPSLLPPHPIPLGHPSAPAPSTCLMHPERTALKHVYYQVWNRSPVQVGCMTTTSWSILTTFCRQNATTISSR